MTNPFQKDATRISAMTPTEDAPINCFSLGNEISYHIKKCLRHFSPLTPTHGGIRGFLFVSSSYIIVL